MVHGKNGYSRGCRCPECRAGHAEYMREWTRKNKERINAQRSEKYHSLSDEGKERKREQSRKRNKKHYYGNLEHARELSRKNAQAWRDRHPGAATEVQRRWREKYPEKAKAAERKRAEYRRRQREREPDYVREQEKRYRRTWKENHPEAWREVNRREHAIRRARKNAAPGRFTRDQFMARVAYWGNKCWLCGGSWDTVDHVKALAVGGSNWPANLRPACRSCNSRKGHR